MRQLHNIEMVIINAVQGVELFSPLGILIFTIGIVFTVGLPVVMIKYGKKDSDL